jgi:hypothetical protein
MAFIVILSALGTLNLGSQVAFTLDAFVGNGKAFAGGAAAWATINASRAASQISNACCIITILFSDGLLVRTLIGP